MQSKSNVPSANKPEEYSQQRVVLYNSKCKWDGWRESSWNIKYKSFTSTYPNCASDVYVFICDNRIDTRICMYACVEERAVRTYKWLNNCWTPFSTICTALKMRLFHVWVKEIYQFSISSAHSARTHRKTHTLLSRPCSASITCVIQAHTLFEMLHDDSNLWPTTAATAAAAATKIEKKTTK